MNNLAKHDDILDVFDKSDIGVLAVVFGIGFFLEKLPSIIDALGRARYRLGIQTAVFSVNLEPIQPDTKAA